MYAIAVKSEDMQRFKRLGPGMVLVNYRQEAVAMTKEQALSVLEYLEATKIDPGTQLKIVPYGAEWSL